ncbi:MAG: glutaminyl-peptide cyclotransferase [Flavobacteriales bacterium]|nr:glutaminyl-peptide cyclotransferase [Flavobacteriales bacterium]
MKNKFLFSFVVLISALLIFSCEDRLNIKSNLKEIEKGIYRTNDTLAFEYTDKNENINSIKVLINEKEIKGTQAVLDSTLVNLGINYITVVFNYSDNKEKSFERYFTVYSSNQEKKGTYIILEELPHDDKLFTQGLEIHNGILYESAGQYGESKIITRNLNSTKELLSSANDSKIFAEGLTIFNDKVYQLSWKSNTVFVYSLDLKLQEELPYPAQLREGWGICNDGTNFYVSSEEKNPNLTILDSNFKYIKSIPVVGYDKLYLKMNELEFANGKIYANIWQENIIIVIEPKTGEVIETYDFSELVNKNKTNIEGVLNGIAHVKDNQFLVTGKNWKTIYKVILD